MASQYYEQEVTIYEDDILYDTDHVDVLIYNENEDLVCDLPLCWALA